MPRKNIKLLNGKPLIYYTIEAAQNVFTDDVIYVSTDDVEIKECVEKLGLKIPFLRPAALATDHSGTYEVILHAVNFAESTGYFPDTVVLLQPTSPFRTGAQIKEAMARYSDDIELLVSVKETRSNPYYVLFEEDEHGYLIKSKKGTFKRRQDCPQVWELNGAIYVINVNALKQRPMSEFTKIVKFEMTELTSLDIDTDLDWFFAEWMQTKFKLV